MIDPSCFDRRSGVAIIAIGNALEALTLRANLEGLGASVALHFVGTPEETLAILGQETGAPPSMILSAHGDENGFVFGDFAPGIDVSALVKGSMPPHAIAARVRLPGRLILSTACLTGSRAFGSAFLSGGAAAYIAPKGYPEGADAALFAHFFFHRLLHRRASVQEALADAHRCDPAFGDFTSAFAQVSDGSST